MQTGIRECRTEEKKSEKKGLKALGILACTYFLTAIILLIFAYVLYKCRLNDGIVNLVIIVVYVLMTFFAGFISGKVFKVKKFIWGLILGCAYFLVLLLVSKIGGISEVVLGTRLISTFFLCAGGGMLGGMLS